MLPNDFNAAGGNINTSRNFYNKLRRLRLNQAKHGTQVTRGRSTNSKTMSFNGQTHLCSMPFVIRVTPGTVDVKISAAAKTVVKARKVQNGH